MPDRTYSEKLRDPMWKKRRVEILRLANFRCSRCGAERCRFDVHHRIYRKGKDPWDYPDEDLECLCRPCHVVAEEEKRHVCETMRLEEWERLFVLVARAAEPHATPGWYRDHLGEAMVDLKLLLMGLEIMEDDVAALRGTEYISRAKYQQVIWNVDKLEKTLVHLSARLRCALNACYRKMLAVFEASATIEVRHFDLASGS